MSQQRMEDNVTKITEDEKRAEVNETQLNQAAAIWDQMEKNATLQAERERLRSNARALQVQYEALAGELQEERRYRSDLINKIKATREICDSVSESTAQCKQSFSLIKKTKEVILAAYQNGNQRVTEMKQAQQKMTVKEVTESQDGLKAFNNHNKCDQELTELKDELTNKANELNWKKEEKQDAYISIFRKEIEDLEDKAKNLQTALEEIGSLKTALNSKEVFIKKLCEEKNSLQEQITVLEEACRKADTANEAYKKNLEDISSMKEALEKNLGTLKAENESLKKERDVQNVEIELGLQELERSTKHLAYQDNEIDKLTSDLENMKKDCQHKTAQITQLEGDKETLTNKLNEVQTAYHDYSLQTALEEIGSLKTALNSKEAFIKKLCEEKNSLQEQITVLEEACRKADTANEAYKKNLEDISSMKEALEKNLGTLKAENESLKKERDHQNVEIELGLQELERSMKHLAYQDNQIDKLTSDLENMKKDCQHKTAQITQLEGDKETLTNKLNEVQTAFNDYRNEVQEEKNNLNVVIEEKVAELELQANTIALLTADLQNEKEERANLEAELKNIRAERENEMKRTSSHLEETIRSPTAHSTPKRQRTDAPMVERLPFATSLTGYIQNFNDDSDDFKEMPLTERRGRIFKSRGAIAKPKKKRA